jgi:hypothetical protein
MSAAALAGALSVARTAWLPIREGAWVEAILDGVVAFAIAAGLA